MRTKTIKIYSFNELSDDAKQIALDKCRYFQVDDVWWDSTYMDAAQIGLKITSFQLDRNRGAEGELFLSSCEVAQNILNNHGENCKTYKTATEFLSEWQPIFNEYMDEQGEHYESSEHEDMLNELENEFLKDLLEDYSIMLQNESEYLTSDEYVADFILANEYEFTEEGNMF